MTCFSPIFTTPAFQDLKLLQKVTDQVAIPVFAIGGISLKNMSTLTAIGVKRMAVCLDICLSSHVKETVRQFKEILGQQRKY